MDGFFGGVLRSQLSRERSLHRVNQAMTDGPIARYYRPNEWRKLCAGLFKVVSVRVLEQKSDLVPLPRGCIKDALHALLPNAVTRGLNGGLALGSFLVADMRRLPE